MLNSKAKQKNPLEMIEEESNNFSLDSDDLSSENDEASQVKAKKDDF
jgi:hypothetical protein